MEQLLLEIKACPVTVALTLVICWVYIKIALKLYDPRFAALTYREVVEQKQHWRLMSSHLCHSSVLVTVLNSTALWSCRIIEKLNGSVWYFKYTLLLAVCESLLSFGIIYVLLSLGQQRVPSLGILAEMLKGMSKAGCTGVLLAWAAYLSIASQEYSSVDGKTFPNFVLLGFVSVPAVFAPLVLTTVSLFLLPSTNLMSVWSGLLCGYLLVMGPLDLLVEPFWSWCFIFNMVLVLIVSLARHRAELVYFPPLQLPLELDTVAAASAYPNHDPTLIQNLNLNPNAGLELHDGRTALSPSTSGWTAGRLGFLGGRSAGAGYGPVSALDDDEQTGVEMGSMDLDQDLERGRSTTTAAGGGGHGSSNGAMTLATNYHAVSSSVNPLSSSSGSGSSGSNTSLMRDDEEDEQS